ncbi:hypothetical protein HBH59_172710 [Parastagonospora nodorum]|nr:hypothetical protein HBH93_166600 [Parastagonospora nodorum]KAH4433213.1 hypothetical protein HBH91_219140 [Parastagonospora nodorum]KAH4862997.1 hypothetical protein HBH59_172710 [Parastagonospora nodorum]KAH4869833.1 hypothetical protein HBH58_153440 [Parastagonospora nodorum]KAH5002366.1 hypothetical protein HBI77_136720 [Parastagonospora nodorum]
MPRMNTLKRFTHAIAISIPIPHPRPPPQGPPNPKWVPYSDPAARSASTTFPLDGATFDICSMPEEELISYGKVAPALHSLGRTKVVRLSKTLAMKFGPTVLASEGLFRTKEAFQKWIDRKLYLNTCNQVWLIDWECAGFYPPILEAASAKHQFQFESFSRLLLPLIYNNPEELAQFEGCSFGIHHVFNSLPPEMESESEQ